MAEFSDIFNRVSGYRDRINASRPPGMEGYSGRLQSVRDAYHQRIEQERLAAEQANAAKWFGAASRNQQPFWGFGAGVRGGGGGFGGGGGGRKYGKGSLDRFMAAISGQESGGDYNITNRHSGAHGRFQIMPGNWGPWSREAGLGRNAPRNAQNQDKVARYKMAQYYRQFGDWKKVAIAWYAGPDAVTWSNRALSRKQGNYPSINDYVTSVMRRMR